MMRWTAPAAIAVALTGAALVTGSSREAAPMPDRAAKAASTTGFFNMTKVMRESKRARTERKRLNANHNRAVNKLYLLRDRYLELQSKALILKNPDRPQNEMLAIARQVEDIDTEAQKALKHGMSALGIKLHDETRETVAGLAKEKGLLAVFAYSDAVAFTVEERNDPRAQRTETEATRGAAVLPRPLD